jgi:hypothetical protein
MPQQNIAFNAAVPRGAVIVSGTSSSGLCQDPNGCVVELPYTVPTYTPQPYDSTVAEVVLPDTPQPQQSEVPMASRPLPQDTASMLGIQRPQQPVGPQCNPGDPYSACATRPMQGYSRQIQGLPQFTPQLTPGTVGSALGAGRILGPRARMAQQYTLASLANETEDAKQELMRQGIDPSTAAAMAQQSAARDQGYSALSQMLGVAGVQDSAIRKAMEREAQNRFLLGAGPAASTRLLGAASPGTYVTGENGQVYLTTSGGMRQQDVAPAMARNPLLGPMLVGGLPLKDAMQRSTDASKASAKTQGVMDRLQEIALRERMRLKAAGAKPSKVDVDDQGAAQKYYSALPAAYKTAIPFTTFYKNEWKNVVKALGEQAELAEDEAGVP